MPIINLVYEAPEQWGRQPWANTFWYYTFDDQNVSQITDFSGNNRNLTWWTMPTYTLVSWTNYAGNYTNVSGSVAQTINYSSLPNTYTILVRVKPTATTSSYISYLRLSNGNNQIALIWSYNSWQFEYFTETSGERKTIKSWASINNWYLIGYTNNWTTVQTYCNWEASLSSTSPIWSYWAFYLWSSRDGDRFTWQIWECVVEDKVRTAQEISDYYNLTKWDYWIS